MSNARVVWSGAYQKQLVRAVEIDDKIILETSIKCDAMGENIWSLLDCYDDKGGTTKNGAALLALINALLIEMYEPEDDTTDD